MKDMESVIKYRGEEDVDVDDEEGSSDMDYGKLS